MASPEADRRYYDKVMADPEKKARRRAMIYRWKAEKRARDKRGKPLPATPSSKRPPQRPKTVPGVTLQMLMGGRA